MTDKIEALEAEAENENAVVELNGHDIEVRPLMEWKTKALRAAREGDPDGWAEGTLTEDGYEAWLEADPTVAEAIDFMERATKLLDAEGKSPKGTKSSRTTRKK